MSFSFICLVVDIFQTSWKSFPQPMDILTNEIKNLVFFVDDFVLYVEFQAVWHGPHSRCWQQWTIFHLRHNHNFIMIFLTLIITEVHVGYYCTCFVFVIMYLPSYTSHLCVRCIWQGIFYLKKKKLKIAHVFSNFMGLISAGFFDSRLYAVGYCHWLNFVSETSD